ncbi:fucolectin-like isoform X1 [Ranitomeya variabilis]|uniref:fucolectin-like isoform X1 n=1 Tax=Ranitomeya variabilis TaxID=490064 RepID=UPI0040576A9A
MMLFLIFVILWISVSSGTDHCEFCNNNKMMSRGDEKDEFWQSLSFLPSSVFSGFLKSRSKTLQNVALRGRSTQSSNFEILSASINAIDGNVDSLYNHGSCFATKSEPSPWWRVDLLEAYRISHITITIRGDCCADLISGAEILIGDSLANNGNNNPRCVTITTIPLAASQTFQCDGMIGRYVNIIRPGITGFLSFCEVEVFATPVNCRCYT